MNTVVEHRTVRWYGGTWNHTSLGPAASVSFVASRQTSWPQHNVRIRVYLVCSTPSNKSMSAPSRYRRILLK